ncbi:sensor histidine kinase [Methylomagnum ishizawai]|uniref:sensor histidine kinase n=1 Tax=Methylomagnum ishizawai TaxID=1760988 RepID=UPI0020CB2CC4|nr:ATP-binding protein [Methylomagnum ishizawai]
MRSFSYKYAQWRGWAVLLLVLLVFALLGGMIWRNLERFETMRAYVSYAHRIQQVTSDLQAALTDYFIHHTKRLDAAQLSRLSAEIGDLAREDYHVAPATPTQLAELSAMVSDLANEGATTEQQEARLLQALNITGAMMDAETLERERLLEDIGKETRTEVELAFVVVAVLLLFVGLFINRRILSPLHDLKELLLRLAREDFTPIGTQAIDPLLLPVFHSYNEMVCHLAELEEAKRHYAESLEAEVRSATRALLEQQASLARTERLAAVGELAAGIAHELRNPLAGIQMSIANLRNELADPEQTERASLVMEELKRMGRLLNELLDQSKHTPAPVCEFNLSTMVGELVSLVRYQVPPGVRLDFEGPERLICRLPECRLRQSLLNLVLNSAEVLRNGEGHILIEVQAEDERVVLSVTDDGPGFGREMLESGIRPFATGRPGGTGLGLAMVQRFARDLGGQLSLANIRPHGARVKLLLPYRCG